MARQRAQDDETPDMTGLSELAQAILTGNERIAEEMRAERAARSKHEEKIVNRLGRYKENPDGSPKRSVFNLRGQRDYPLPALKCRLFAPHPIDPDPEISGMTREEIELVNLLEPGEYRFTLNDQSMTTMVLSAVKNKATGKVEQMRVETPAFDREMFKQMPPMRAWLREVLSQHPDDIPARADAVLTMKQEKDLIAKGELEVAV